MVEMYYKLVSEGKRTIESVPIKYREAVEKLINQGAEQ